MSANSPKLKISCFKIYIFVKNEILRKTQKTNESHLMHVRVSSYRISNKHEVQNKQEAVAEKSYCYLEG